MGYASSDSISKQLRLAVQQLEVDFDEGRLNTFSLRSLGDAAVMLDQTDVAERVRYLLDRTPDELFFAGMLTNFALPSTAPKSMRELSSKELAEKKRPSFNRDAFVARLWAMAATENHIKYVLEGKIDQAVAAAKCDRELEEVPLTMVVLGDFENALSVAEKAPLEPFRRESVRFVMLMELALRGRHEESAKLLADFESTGFYAGARIQLALAIGGREPWAGYPYPDW
jgi:hypothetical protein